MCFTGGETRTKSNIEIGKWDNPPAPDNEWSSSSKIKTYLDSEMRDSIF